MLPFDYPPSWSFSFPLLCHRGDRATRQTFRSSPARAGSNSRRRRQLTRYGNACVKTKRYPSRSRSASPEPHGGHEQGRAVSTPVPRLDAVAGLQREEPRCHAGTLPRANATLFRTSWTRSGASLKLREPPSSGISHGASTFLGRSDPDLGTPAGCASYIDQPAEAPRHLGLAPADMVVKKDAACRNPPPGQLHTLYTVATLSSLPSLRLTASRAVA